MLCFVQVNKTLEDNNSGCKIIFPDLTSSNYIRIQLGAIQYAPINVAPISQTFIAALSALE